jgi:hypothetical protein
MSHPGLLMARMVAATPKQIAMARQMVNSESHILHPPNSLSYLSCVFAACSASVSQRSAISMKNDLCAEVWATSANLMHSAALLRN